MPFSNGLDEGLRGQVRGSGMNWFLPFEEGSRERAEMSSYRHWQEPVLATFKGSRDRAEMSSYRQWQEPVLATLLINMWQELVLAIYRSVSRQG